MTIQFSRRLAIVGGILAPLAETIRRWSTWRQSPASLFDDYILGAFLLYGAWRTGKDLREGRNKSSTKSSRLFHRSLLRVQLTKSVSYFALSGLEA